MERADEIRDGHRGDHRRTQARRRPATALPDLADCLTRFGWQVSRQRPEDGIRHFEEAAAIYRRLAAGGAEADLGKAVRAVSTLGTQYSRVHADSPALAAREEATEMARRLGRRPADAYLKIFMDLACALAEAGRFTDAVTVQFEVVDSNPGSALAMWALLEAAIYLDLAGRIDESIEIEHRVLARQRRQADAGAQDLTALAIWTAGSSQRFADTGHPDEAGRLLRESVTICGRLPAEGPQHDFGYHRAIQAALFARSGARDERSEALRPGPIGVDPDRALQPVHGLGFHHWSFSVRNDYRAGLAAIDEAITAGVGELATLRRRRAIRTSVLDDGPLRYREELIPALAHNVDLERRLVTLDPSRNPHRLIRALTDQAMADLVTGANSRAADALGEAENLHTAADASIQR